MVKRNGKPQSEQGYVSVDDYIGLNEGNKPIPIDLHLPKEIGKTQADDGRSTNCREEAGSSEVADLFDDATLTLAVLPHRLQIVTQNGGVKPHPTARYSPPFQVRQAVKFWV